MDLRRYTNFGYGSQHIMVGLNVSLEDLELGVPSQPGSRGRRKMVSMLEQMIQIQVLGLG